MAWREVCGSILVALAAIGCTEPQPEVVPEAQEPAEVEPADTRPTLDIELDRLAEELASYIEIEIVHEHERRVRVAVVPFVVDGEVTNFGKLLADEIYTRLFKTGKFELVEREKIDAVLDEQNLGSSALMDERTVANLGRVVGAQALCMGSARTYGNVYRVNAKLVNTSSSTAIGVASAQIEKSGEETTVDEKDRREPGAGEGGTEEGGGEQSGGDEPGGDGPGGDESGGDEPENDGE